MKQKYYIVDYTNWELLPKFYDRQDDQPWLLADTVTNIKNALCIEARNEDEAWDRFVTICLNEEFLVESLNEVGAFTYNLDGCELGVVTEESYKELIVK